MRYPKSLVSILAIPALAIFSGCYTTMNTVSTIDTHDSANDSYKSTNSYTYYSPPVIERVTPRFTPRYNNIEQIVKDDYTSLYYNGYVKDDEILSLSVYDLKNSEYLLNINNTCYVQTASMCKPFIALAYLDQVKNGKLKYTKTVESMMEKMLRESNNDAATWLMKKIGGPNRVHNILCKYGNIFHDTYIGEYIPSDGSEYNNHSSVNDYTRFLKALWNNDLPYSFEIKRLMENTGADRMKTGVDNIPQNYTVFSKSGSNGYTCGDMGIICAVDENNISHPYSVAIVISKKNKCKNFRTWIEDRKSVLRRISSIVYAEMKGRYNLE